jgi:GNAT superfamily N-acetyltransferase
VTSDENVFAIQATDSPTDDQLDRLKHALIASNDQHVAFELRRPIAAFIEHDGELLGGVSGSTHWGWLAIDRLWVSNELRGRGLGVKLMTTVEERAIDRGCHASWLDTFSFQAKPFYESLGYKQFGELDEFPAGFQRHFLSKRLRKS